MKKSRIILPAIALLAVSGIASVTGTVAWFTASSQVNGSVDNIAAIATTGDLRAEFKKAADGSGNAYAGWGVTGHKDDNGALSASLPLLRDASYDNVNGFTYSANWDSTGAIDSYTKVQNDATQTVDTKVAYYTASFTVTFIVDNIGSGDTYYLFFDNTAASYMTHGTQVGTKDIDEAFRVSMASKDHKTVWAPGSSSASVAYVNGTTKTSTSTYSTSANNLMTSEKATSKYTSTTAANNVAAYLGSMDSTAASLDVEFVFWFDGEDPACKIDFIKSAASSLAMSFYAVRKAA